MHDLHRYGTDLTALHVQGYLQLMLPVTFFALLSQEVAVKMTEKKAIGNKNLENFSRSPDSVLFSGALYYCSTQCL